MERSWVDLGWCWGGLWGVLGRLGAVLGSLEVALGDPGVVLGGLGADFGRSWAVLGGLGELLGRSWGALGGSWGDFGRSKIDPKIVPKIDPKSSRIRDGQNRSGATPVVVSEASGDHRKSHRTTQKNYQNRYRYD